MRGACYWSSQRIREEPSECPPIAAYISFGAGQWASVVTWPCPVMLLLLLLCYYYHHRCLGPAPVSRPLFFTLDCSATLSWSPVACHSTVAPAVRPLHHSFSTLSVSMHILSVYYSSILGVAALWCSMCICWTDELTSVIWNREASELVFQWLNCKC